MSDTRVRKKIIVTTDLQTGTLSIRSKTAKYERPILTAPLDAALPISKLPELLIFFRYTPIEFKIIEKEDM